MHSKIIGSISNMNCSAKPAIDVAIIPACCCFAGPVSASRRGVVAAATRRVSENREWDGCVWVSQTMEVRPWSACSMGTPASGHGRTWHMWHHAGAHPDAKPAITCQITPGGSTASQLAWMATRRRRSISHSTAMTPVQPCHIPPCTATARPHLHQSSHSSNRGSCELVKHGRCFACCVHCRRHARVAALSAARALCGARC
jgi:hypothetical protein